MKILISRHLLIFLSLLFVFASCEKESDDSSSQKEVEMDFPDNWSVSTDVNNYIVLLGRSPQEGDDDDFRENVNVAVENARGLSLQEYYDANIKSLESFYDFTLVSSVDTTLNSYMAKKFIFTAVTNSYPVKVMDFLIVEDNYGYVITCTAEQDTFDAYKQSFEEIAGTFQFVE